VTEDEYVPLPPSVIEAMPDAQVVKRRLLDAIDTEYSVLVKARGDVTSREDVFPVVRKIASWLEQARDLKGAFEAARKRTAELLEDEVAAAVGEQDGVPNSGLDVPDAAGDIKLSVNTANEYHIDVDTLISATAAVHLGGEEVDTIRDIVNGDHPTIAPDQLDDVLAELVSDAARSILACGKFEPQVTKVRAYADAISRGGEDALSGVVRESIRKTVKFKGVEMKRKAN
jgi:hypothetical protein